MNGHHLYLSTFQCVVDVSVWRVSVCGVYQSVAGVSSAGHYCDNLSRYFIVISFSLSFIAIKKSLSLSIYRYRDTFVPKSAIIDNKIQQVIEKQFHT